VLVNWGCEEVEEILAAEAEALKNPSADEL
jgi:hypothetical protein